MNDQDSSLAWNPVNYNKDQCGKVVHGFNSGTDVTEVMNHFLIWFKADWFRWEKLMLGTEYGQEPIV